MVGEWYCTLFYAGSLIWGFMQCFTKRVWLVWRYRGSHQRMAKLNIYMNDSMATRCVCMCMRLWGSADTLGVLELLVTVRPILWDVLQSLTLFCKQKCKLAIINEGAFGMKRAQGWRMWMIITMNKAKYKESGDCIMDLSKWCDMCAIHPRQPKNDDWVVCVRFRVRARARACTNARQEHGKWLAWGTQNK